MGIRFQLVLVLLAMAVSIDSYESSRFPLAFVAGALRKIDRVWWPASWHTLSDTYLHTHNLLSNLSRIGVIIVYSHTVTYWVARLPDRRHTSSSVLSTTFPTIVLSGDDTFVFSLP